MDVSTEHKTVYSFQVLNERIIADYIQARKAEANLAESTQRVMTDNLSRFPRYVKKDVKDVTRDDLISFLNSLRKTGFLRL